MPQRIGSHSVPQESANSLRRPGNHMADSQQSLPQELDLMRADRINLVDATRWSTTSFRAPDSDRCATAEHPRWPIRTPKGWTVPAEVGNIHTPMELVIITTSDCRNYAYEHGIDKPEILSWKWPK